MPLHLVPPAEPSPQEKVLKRVRALPKRFDGMLQCNRCGCRTSLTTTNGTYFKDGRRINGTVIEKDVCANCFKAGIKSPMLPAIKPA